MEKKRNRSHSSGLYGTFHGDGVGNLGDTCPTCRGIGRIPRGHQDQLVAVIPCSDQRLKPSRTKLYVCISIAITALICSLILFFLFPRTVTLTPVSVLSAFVYFQPSSIDIVVTNLLNISNENFFEVQILDLDIQVLIYQTVVGRTKISNMTAIKSASQKSYTVDVPFAIDDYDLTKYCKSNVVKIHSLFLHLQMNLDVSYLAHSEQISKDAFEYIDCGVNTTLPHPVMDVL